MKKITLTFVSIASILFAGSAFAQDDFSKGTDYHLIYLDDVTTAKIPVSDIKQDYRPKALTYYLFSWSGTYHEETPTGNNWNGVPESYINYTVGTQGWSGMGFASEKGFLKDMSAVTSEFYLHVAFKSNDAASHLIGMNGASSTISGRVNIGSAPYVNGGITFEPYTDFVRDGEWHVVEIPMSVFFNQGVDYSLPVDPNVFYLLSGGIKGTPIAIDAIFVYRKVAAGLNDVKAELNVILTNRTLTVLNATKPIELYNYTGQRIKMSKETIMDIENVQKGIYIVQSGNLKKKIIIN